MESKTHSTDYFSDEEEKGSDYVETSEEEEEEEEDDQDETEAEKHRRALDLAPIDDRHLTTALKEMFKTGEFADVTFVVGKHEDEAELVEAHRLILAAASPVFEHMLYDPSVIEEQSSSKDKRHKEPMVHTDGDMVTIRVRDTRVEIFRLLLDVVYFNQAEFNPLDIPELLACAEKYRVERAIVVCRQLLKSGINKHNACALFHVAVEIASRIVFNHVVKYISTHTLKCVQSKAFEEMPLNSLKVFLALDCLDINEVALFNGVLRWAVEECRRRGVVFGEGIREDILREVLPYIRFPLMDAEAFSSTVLSTGVLSDDIAVDVFRIKQASSSRTNKDGNENVAYFSRRPRKQKYDANKVHISNLIAASSFSSAT